MVNIKILMGIPAPSVKGGPPTHLPYLVEYFQKNDNFDIKTFFYGSHNAVLHENIFQKVLNTLKVFFQFIKLIFVFKPDVIHLNSAFDKKSIFRDVPFSIICKLLGKPVLFKIHGSHYELLFTKNKLLIFLIKLYFWGASNVGVLSDIERKEFISQFGNPSKIIVVKNIIREVNMNCLSWNVSNRKFDALFVSRIEKGKGLEDLLNAVPCIIKSFPQFLLAIAGSGNNLNNCMELAAELNISKNIKWLGHIPNEDLDSVFNQSKIFVFTSRFPEGMPMSMIEALIAGLPTITTETRFAKSYFEDEENVLFVKSAHATELAKRIVYLLGNEQVHEKMRVKNFYFLSQFTQKRVGEEFSAFYNQMRKKNQ